MNKEEDEYIMWWGWFKMRTLCQRKYTQKDKLSEKEEEEKEKQYGITNFLFLGMNKYDNKYVLKII